jgi:hypothetical protein
LNTGVWFRRGRLLIVSPVRGHHRRYQAETPLIPLSRFAEPAMNASVMTEIPRVFLMGIIAAYLSGCATKPPEVTDQERNDAMNALISCLHAAAKKLDDNRSEASTVALGLRSLCAAEFAPSREVYGRHLNPAARQMYDRKEQEAFIQIATTAVLDERAKRR